MSEPACECSGPGFCPRYQIEQTSYAHAVCRGEEFGGRPCPPAKSEEYRRKWRINLEVRQAPPPLNGRPAARRPQRYHVLQPAPAGAHPPSQPRPASNPPAARPKPPGKGPGTELTKLFKVGGVDKWAGGCGNCQDFADWMDRLGPDGCDRPENRSKILTRLREQAARLGWVAKLTAGFNLAGRGVILNPADPAGSLLDLAIRRAREQEQSGEGGTSDTTGGTAGGGLITRPAGPPAATDRQPQDGARGGPDPVGPGTPEPAGIHGLLPAAFRRYRVNPPGPPAAPTAGPGGPAIRPAPARPVTRAAPPPKAPKWEVGVTTVPVRRHDLLPRTLASLTAAGFPQPRLFVDGCDPGLACWYEKTFDLPLTARHPKVNGYANWCLTLAEMFLRNPAADRYAIFQDDVLACLNLRPYLDTLPYPPKGYYNLTTFRENERLAGAGKPPGWVQAVEQCPHPIAAMDAGTGKRPQGGRGAMGLVFDRPAVLALIQHPHLSKRLLPEHKDPDRCYRHIDGAVVEALNSVGFREYVHNPSLLQHNGPRSTLSGRVWDPGALCRSWPGEQFDCITLLPAAAGAAPR